MSRSLRVLVAAALTVSTFVGASAADAATGSASPTSLTHAATAAHADASALLGGIALPAAATTQLRAASVAFAASGAQSVRTIVHVKVKAKRYDIRVVSVGSKSDPTRIRLVIGTHAFQVAVRRLVRITVIRHGYHRALLETTTTFRRFVVMTTDLASNPLTGSQTHFATRSAFVAALANGLALDETQLTREYGAALRFAQMSLDLASTLLQAAQLAVDDPSATDLSTVPTTHTTTGSGGYAGAVTLAGTRTAFTVTATNTTDDSSLSETLGQQSLTITYTVHGTTYTHSL